MKKLVIIPTYNEIENISKISKAVLALDGDFHVLVVDDGSPDGTATAVKTLQKAHPNRLHLIERSGKLGLGTAYVTGFRWGLEQGYDYIFEIGINVVNWPLGRILMSNCASIYVRTVLGFRIFDSTAGFVCYSRKVLETIDLDAVRMKGYGFQIEMKYTAHRLGFRIAEVPVIFVNRKEGTSKMSGGIFGEAFWGVMALRFRKFHAAR